MVLAVEWRPVEPGITVVALVGRLTLGNLLTDVEQAIKSAIAQGCRKLVLDLHRLEFLDSAGIGMLVMCAGEMEKVHGEMRIAGPNARVAQTFGVIHIARLVPVLEDVDAACGSFASGTSSATGV
jgi:anti-sigma B factor antagonist